MTTSELPQVEADAVYEGLDKTDPNDAASWADTLRGVFPKAPTIVNGHATPVPVDDGMWNPDHVRPDGGPTFAVEQWETGAIRDSQGGKPRFDLIDPKFLYRMAQVMTKGADHYGPFNWTKGIPSQRYAASLLRHVYAYLSGDRSEDHLGAAAFNLQGLARNEGTDQDDLFRW